MNNDIWIVSYSTGKYSDRTDWAVAWYPTEADAEAHRAAFDAVLDEALAAYRAWYEANGWGPYENEWYAALRAFRLASPPHRTLAALMDEGAGTLYPADINPASVSRVPRGTLPLHGLEEAR